MLPNIFQKFFIPDFFAISRKNFVFFDRIKTFKETFDNKNQAIFGAKNMCFRKTILNFPNEVIKKIFYSAAH